MKVIRIGAVVIASAFLTSCKLEDCTAFWNKWDMEEAVGDIHDLTKDGIKLVALRDVRSAPLDLAASEGSKKGYTCKAKGLMSNRTTLNLTFTFYKDKDGNSLISTDYEEE